MMIAKVSVSETVRYVPDDDHEDEPLAAIVTKVHDDGCVCLAYWCPDSKAFKEATGVPPFGSSNADANGPYFLRAGET